MLTNEVLSCPEGRLWKVAVGEEKQALIKNETWTVVKKDHILAGQRILTSKWIFKKKEDVKYKARLVVRGCQQVMGIDCGGTYSPVLNSGPIWALLGIAKRYRGKGMYGEHHLKLARICPLKSECCVFKNADGSVILGLVDDGVVVGKDCRVVYSLLEVLEREFEVVAQLLEAYNMTEAKQPQLRRRRKGRTEKELRGSVVYLSKKTRPDIAYASPTEEDIVSIKQILRYLRGTENLEIRFGGSSPMEGLVSFCDADFTGDSQSRRSNTGYVIYYSGGPIIWCARKQPVVALSTAEAEYIVTAEFTKELIYLKAILEKILGKEVTARLHVDNQTALSLMKNGLLIRRSKHIDVQFHYIHGK
ncbi:hypothetical protein PR048_005431, partial [Dryococelus australis]